MPRKANDGRGRISGRTAGTPNKDKPLKTFLRQHSVQYFTPSIEDRDDAGNKTGRLISQFDKDCRDLDPQSRVDAEIKLLKFHTPLMQATTVDMSIAETNKTLSERLALLAAGQEITPSPE